MAVCRPPMVNTFDLHKIQIQSAAVDGREVGESVRIGARRPPAAVAWHIRCCSSMASAFDSARCNSFVPQRHVDLKNVQKTVDTPWPI